MALLVTVEHLRQHVESDRPDDALARILESVEAELVERFGPVETVTETRYPMGGTTIQLRQQPAAIASVTDSGVALALGSEVIGDANGGTLYRGSGFVGPVVVTYTPSGNHLAKRRLAIIDLAKLELAYSGYKSQSTPDASETPADYDEARAAIFRRLRNRRALFA